MAASINKDDIISKDILDEFIRLDTSLKNILETIKMVAIESSKIGTNLKGAKSLEDLSKAQKEAAESTKELTEQEKQLNAINKQIEKQQAKLNDEYIEQARQLAETKKQIGEKIKEEKSEENSIIRLQKENKRLREERNKVNTATKEGQRTIRDLNKQIDANNKVIKNNSDKLAKQKINIGNYQSALEGVSPAFSTAANSGRAFLNLLKLIIANPIVLTLTAIVGVLAAIGKAFKSTQRGAELFDKVTSAIGATFDVLRDRLAIVADNLISAFKNPQRAIKDLWQVIKENLLNRIEALGNLFIGLKDIGVNTFKLIGASIKNIFTDNEKAVDNARKNIQKGATDIKDALIQATTGLDKEQRQNIIDGFNDIAKEINEESKAAYNLKAALQALEKDEINFIVRKGELTRAIAENREAARDESIEIGKRIKLLEEAQELQKELSATEQNLATRRANIISQQIALGDSLNEDLRAEAEARAEADFIAAASSKKQKGILLELTTLRNKLNKTIQGGEKDNQKSIDETYKKIKEGLVNITNDEQLTYEERLSKLDEFYQISYDKYKEDKEKQLELDKLYNEKKKEIIDSQIDYEKQRRMELWEASQELGNALFDFSTQLNDNQLLKLEEAKAKELQLAGDDAEKKKKIEEKYAAEVAKIKRKQAIQEKVQAIFNIGINTAVGISKAVAASPLTSGLPWSAIVAAIGAAQIATVLARKIPEFWKGIDNFEGGAAFIGERGTELIKENDGSMWLSPNKKTLTYLNPGTDVIPHQETQRILANMPIQNMKVKQVSNKENEILLDIAKSQKMTNKILKNKKHVQIINRGGESHIIEHIGNTQINRYDKYYRGIS